MSVTDPAHQERGEASCNCGATGDAAEIQDHIARMTALPHNTTSDYHSGWRPSCEAYGTSSE